MNAKSGANRTDDKGVDAKYTNHSLDEVASMVHGTVSAFDTKVQLLPNIWQLRQLTMIMCT
jgi:exocyst complex component 2